MSQLTSASLISSSFRLDLLSHSPRSRARTFEAPPPPRKDQHFPQKLQKRRDLHKDRRESLSAKPEKKLTSRPHELLHRSFSGESIGTKTLLRRPSLSSKYYASVTPVAPPPLQQQGQLSPADLAFLLLGFISCVTAGAFIGLVAALIPTLNALRRTALSVDRIATSACKELPVALASIRQTGLEISDATMGLTDLSQEISEGWKSSTRLVKSAEDGIRRLGVSAASKTLTLLQACLQS